MNTHFYFYVHKETMAQILSSMNNWKFMARGKGFWFFSVTSLFNSNFRIWNARHLVLCKVDLQIQKLFPFPPNCRYSRTQDKNKRTHTQTHKRFPIAGHPWDPIFLSYFSHLRMCRKYRRIRSIKEGRILGDRYEKRDLSEWVYKWGRNKKRYENVKLIWDLTIDVYNVKFEKKT